MHACNFEYDGQLLSDFGFIVCSFDTASDVSAVQTGSEISFETAPVQRGKRFYNVGTQFKTCLSATFQICKDTSANDGDEMIITHADFRRLSRWLNRREFLWFHFFDLDVRPEVEQPWFRASFTLTKIDFGSDTIGVELKMVTDSPFGYGQPINKTLSFTALEPSVVFRDQNDEIGDTYPELTITCDGSGTLTLSNDLTGCSFEVENCSANEVLHLSGESMMISTDSVTHALTLANDFNYDFFSFGNTYDTRENTITASIPCTVEISYRPILKDTL